MVDKLLTENYRKAGLVDPLAPPLPLRTGLNKESRSLTHYAEEQSFVFVSKSVEGFDDVSFTKVEKQKQNKTLFAISAR